MLKKLPCILLSCIFVACAAGIAAAPRALADDGCVAEAGGVGGGFGGTVTVSLECGGVAGGGTGAGGELCVNSAGEAIPCERNGFPWEPSLNLYCRLLDLSHIYGPHSTHALTWKCDLEDKYWWIAAGPIPTPADELAHEAAATLTLHPATVNIGAWEKKEWPGYGRVWWVGAPVWLWIDTDDSLAWGAHTVTVSDPTLTVTATVWATHVTFTTGDGNSITCAGPGTPRAYDLTSLISEHSPSGCEHTYMSTSVLGDPASNYVVSATVIWRTDWTATNGESGAFTLTIPGANTPTIHVGELRVVTR